MTTNIVKVDPTHPDQGIMNEAGRIIRCGGLVAFPTETVYGLAADCFNLDAVMRVFEVKGRPENKPLPVQVATTEQVSALAAEVNRPAEKLMAAYFPGPLTIIIPAKPSVPEIVTAGTGKIGIRMPNHAVALALIRAAGTPIVAPSANTSGDPSPNTAEEVANYLYGKVDMILDAGPSQIKTASTVVDVTVTPPKILRLGVITEAQILAEIG